MIAAMKFSIVTPSFNQASFIEETINSVINQEGDFEIEYIVMDGGSTDETIEILKKYEKKLKGNKRITFYWQSKKDKGQSDAINQGLKRATGDILAFINSDDYYEPGIFKKIAIKFLENPEKKWLTGYSRIVNENGTQIQTLITYYKNFWLNNYTYNTLLIMNYISQPSTFWKREVFQNFGDFDESLHLTMDYDYWLKIGKIHTPLILKGNISNFRIHSTSKGKLTFLKQFDEDYQTMLRQSPSCIIRFLHKFHNILIKVSYLVLK